MSQVEGRDAGKSAVYVSPVAQRRAEFGNACGGLFGDLRLADGAERALERIAAGQPDLLVIDLDRFEPGIDLAALGELVARRSGAPTLLLCPYATARWLPALAAYGPVAYAVTPIEADALQAAVARQLAGPAAQSAGPGDPERLRALLALRTRVQAAVRAAAHGEDEVHALADGLCRALTGWPGVRHAALFHRKPDGDLQLEAQSALDGKGEGEDGGPAPLALQTLLGRPDRLLQAPLRHAFPGLLAAATGELVLLDTLDQAGEPDLAALLRGHGVAMALGIAIPADGPGAPRGALSLLWDSAHALAPEEFAALQDVAALAALGLRLAEMAL